MKVRDIMTASVESIEATESIADAARLMGETDVGILPVTRGDRIAGIVTDRDLVVRGLAAGLPADSPVTRVMTHEVALCSEDDELEDVLRTMADEQIRRMPVCAGDRELVGIVTLADAARFDRDKDEVTRTLADICHPSGHHCQAMAAA